MPDLLRETFETYAERAPRADGLRHAVEARVRRHRRHAWTTAGAAVLATAAVVAGVAVVADRPARRPAVVAAAPGTRWFARHGVEVAVPVAWLSGKVWCGFAQEDAVVVEEGPVASCLPPVPPHLNVVTFGAADRIQRVFTGEFEESDDTVDGVPVRRMVGRTYAGQYVEALVVPSRAYSVRVSTDDPAVARRVLDTARIADVDSYGCQAHPASLFAFPPEREEALRAMVPPGFTEASACRYVGGWAVQSGRLDAAGAAQVADVLNGLTPGFTTPPGNARKDDDETRGAAIVVTFRYPSGPPISVFVHVQGRRELGASNGAVTGRLSSALQDVVEPVAGWASYFPTGLY